VTTGLKGPPDVGVPVDYRAALPSGPRRLGTRRAVLLLITVTGVWAAFHLQLDPRGLIPDGGGLRLAGRFFGAALTPALTYEASFVPEGAPPFLQKVINAMAVTVSFAAAASSLSLIFGVPLAFVSSQAWWASGDEGAGARRVIHAVGPVVYGVSRVVIGLSRSVHELLWAVLFLAAMGLTPLAAVVAIAIPYSGTLAKVFSEMIDEAPRDTARALRDAGAGPLSVFFFGLLPRALPDMLSYAFYRFECALRSAAVLGFFGIPTLGLFIRESFTNAQYHEVWTYLYAMFALVLVADAWSGRIRRRLVA